MMRKPAVLIAEDDASLRSFLSLALRDEGYEVLPARDGSEALDLALVAHPDCILLDLRMPRMDGTAFARRYRDLAAQPAPIIAMSAHAEAGRAMEEVQPAAFVPKPFELDALLDAVASYCKAAEDQQANAEQAS